MTNYNERLDEILLKYSSENFDADYEADDAKRELAKDDGVMYTPKKSTQE